MAQPSNPLARAGALPSSNTQQHPLGMRLAAWEAAAIRRAAAEHFGAGVRVWLFGSRADPSRRGGDIDLYLEPDAAQPDTLERELRLYAALQLALGEQRIDLVVRPHGSPDRAIHREAKRTGVEL